MPILHTIETDRLLLRPFKIEDAAPYHAVETDSEVKQFLCGPSRRSVEYYRDIMDNGKIHTAPILAVTLKINGTFVGRCGFTEYVESLEIIGWEVNIVLGRDCPRQKGYATEIGLKLIPHGFDVLGCDTIFGVVDVANIGSIRLCEKLRMKHIKDTVRYGRPARVYAIEKDKPQ